MTTKEFVSKIDEKLVALERELASASERDAAIIEMEIADLMRRVGYGPVEVFGANMANGIFGYDGEQSYPPKK